jgi:hypothetical protein
MKSKLLPTLYSVVTSAILVGSIAVWQPHFVAGSLGDLACEAILIPGKLFASMFSDRGTASPEFLWRSYTATGVILSAFLYFLLWRRTATR